MLSVPSSRRAAPRAGHLAVVVGVLAVLPFAVSRIVQRAPDFDQACRDGDPFLVVSSLRGQASRSRAPDPRAPSIVLFRDTPNDNPQYALATFRETGAVWGLAYRRSEPAVYAAAYHKRGLTYGPDGPGAVYRIDLTTGDVDLFVTVPDAGDQRRGPSFARGLRDDDADAGRFVGKTALGDIDLDADEKELFVVNLASRRIYRYEMPSGTLLGSFDHGAAAEPWSREARPFGLAYHAGHLYHGVVNDQGNGDEFVGVIYRSEPDGSAMTAVAVLDLRYRRDGIRLKYASTSTNWGPWQDGAPMPSSPERPLDLPQVRPPQPMLTDLTFTADGTMVVGLRDRRWDLSLQWIKEEVTYGPTVVSAHGLQPTPTPAPPLQLSETGMGFGDLLLGRPDGEQWRIQTDPEHFDDTNAVRHAESALGGLAWIPDTTTVAATAYGAVDAHSDAIIGEEGVHWYDVPTGNKTGLEGVGRPGRPRPYSELLRGSDVALAHCTAEVYLDFSFYSDLGSLGDLEVLCLPEHTVPTPTLTAPVEVTPTPTPTDTPVPPTVSVTPTDTPTSPTPTPTVTVLTPTPTPTPTVSPTPTPRPRPCYLPINVRESPCKPDLFFGDVALVLDMSTSMRHSTQTGQVKLDAVLAAARYFVGRMKLESTEGSRHDQVAVVGFNDQAWIQSPLGNDRAAIDDALSALPEGILEGTRLDLAFATGAAALPPERRITGNLAVMVVLTDGLPNRVPVADDGTTETTVRHAAHAAKAAGIRIYTIGVGRTDPDAEIAERIDAVLLAACASSPEMFYHEPDAAQLDRVYGQIVTQIDPCRGRSYWGNR